MSEQSKLLWCEADNTLGFGDYKSPEKKKLSDFEYNGDLYKVKTYNEITKLEKNGMFLYESVPGTLVSGFNMTDTGVEFTVEASKDVQITLGLEEEAEYEVFVDDASIGTMKTNMSGKLVLSVELNDGNKVKVRVHRK